MLYSLQNYRSEPFTADTLRLTSTPGAVFLLDVPRVADPVRVFDQMKLAAKRMTQTLDAALVDDNRRAARRRGARGDPRSRCRRPRRRCARCTSIRAARARWRCSAADGGAAADGAMARHAAAAQSRRGRARVAALRREIDEHNYRYYVHDAPTSQRRRVRRAVPRAAGARGAAIRRWSRPTRRRSASAAPPPAAFDAGHASACRCCRSTTRSPTRRSRPSTGACARALGAREASRVRGRAQVRRPRDQPASTRTAASPSARRAATASSGEDVTANLRTVGAIPLRCSHGERAAAARGARRGADAEARLRGAQRGAAPPAGEKTFVNPRNAAAGALRQLDPEGDRGAPPHVLRLRRRRGRLGARAAARNARGAAATGSRRLRFPVDGERAVVRGLDGLLDYYRSDRRAPRHAAVRDRRRRLQGQRSRAAGAARLRLARAALRGRAQVSGRGDGDRGRSASTSRSGAPARMTPVARLEAGVRRRRDRDQRDAAQRGRGPAQGRAHRRHA